MKLSLLVFTALFGCALCIPAPACQRTRRNPARYCEDPCEPSSGCRGQNKNKNCVCDGDCGYSCVPKGLTCDRPPRFKNGKQSVTGGTLFNATIRYRCNKPYKLRGSATRKCRGIGKWDGKRARCKIICDEPGDIPFGNKRIEGRRKDNTVTYWCFPGYNLDGAATITCGSNAKWDRDPPRCALPSCKSPPTPQNSVVRYPRVMRESFRYGQRIIYRCEAGTSLAGFGVRECRVNGWTKLNFRCIAKSCGDPGTPEDGKKQGYLYTFKEKVYYSCDHGYQLNGPRYRQCYANQQWSGRLPSCDPVDCGPLPVPNKGEKTVEGKTTFGGRMIFRCHESMGFELKGFKLRICGANGKWNGTQPTCQLISCGDPGTPLNGKQIATRGYVYTSFVQFSCNPLYKMRGNLRIICQRDKNWSGAVPKCFAPCPRPAREKARNVRGDDFRHGESITFSCDRDYIMVGKRQISCDNGRWIGNFPHCKAPCSNPGTPKNGNIRRRSRPYRHRDKVTFSCYPKHKRVGNIEISCNDGEWSDGLPRCIPICDNPGNIRNGQRTGNDFLDGKVVSYSCYRNYDLFGSRSMRCNNGKWNAATPSCKGRCNKPGDIRNGRKEGTDYRHSKKVTYRCTHWSYVIDGRDTLKCDNGRWDNKVPRCQAPCNQPFQLKHGWINGNDYRHGQIVTYNCNVDFSLVGPPTRTCNNGDWSANAPQCKASCGPPNPVANGNIIGNDFHHNREVTYRCNQDYIRVGLFKRRCDNGVWFGNAPLCKAPCKDPGSPKNGGKGPRNRRQYTHGTILNFYCNVHNNLIGNNSITCNDGAWGGRIPLCTPVCKDPGQVAHGIRAGTSFLDGERITYTCRQGYIMVGSNVLQCKKGKWLTQKPTCKAPCGKPVPITNGNIIGKDFNHSKHIRYACNSQYVLDGNSELTCVDGTWNSSAPMCKVAPCKKIESISNGRVRIKGNLSRSQLTFDCNVGYKLQGSKTMLCSNGTWNPVNPPVCKELYRHIGCYNDTKSRTLPELLEYVTSVQQCYQLADAKGYTVFGIQYGQECRSSKNAVATYKHYGKTKTCTNGMGARWANDVYVISSRVNCTEPQTPLNGMLVGSHLVSQHQVKFQCSQGYDLFGVSSITCLLNGKWSASPPTCEARCSRFVNPRNGVVIGNNTRSRQNVTLKCNKGFKLKGESRLACKDGNWSHDIPKCSADNCIQVGSKVLGRWTRNRIISIYQKAVITGLDTSTVKMVLDRTTNRFRRPRSFYKTDSLAFIMDRVPDTKELIVNTRVVALYNDKTRYFSGKISYYSKSLDKYEIVFDDNDSVFATLSTIRLLKKTIRYCIQIPQDNK